MMAAKTEFASLPRELRDIIWVKSLPPPRLVTLGGLCRVRFDHLNGTVQRAYKLWFHDQEVSESQRVEPSNTTHCFNFCERYPPPVITQICRESRQFALRAGYFLLPAWGGSDAGAFGQGPDEDAFGQGPDAAWFNGTTDVLFIEGSRVPFFLTTAPFRIPNAARVHRVGVDWKYVQGGGEMSPQVWGSHSSRVSFRRRLLSLYAYTPGLMTLLLVRPGVRCRYSLQRRRDEDEECLRGSGGLEARLVPIPLSARIGVPTEEHIIWEDVLGALRAVLDEKSARERWREVYRGSVVFPPEMVGCDVEWVKAGQ